MPLMNWRYPRIVNESSEEGTIHKKSIVTGILVSLSSPPVRTLQPSPDEKTISELSTQIHYFHPKQFCILKTPFYATKHQQ